ncbi:ferredoxin, partial [Streptomyces sp. 2MCAF27]
MKVTADEDKCCAAGSSVLAAPDVFDRRGEDGIVEDRRRPGQGIFGRLRT